MEESEKMILDTETRLSKAIGEMGDLVVSRFHWKAEHFLTDGTNTETSRGKAWSNGHGRIQERPADFQEGVGSSVQ